MNRRNAIIAIIVAAVVLITGDSCVQRVSEKYVEPIPKTYSLNFTAQQAIGIVVSAINASTPTIRASSGYYSAQFNSSSRQWRVTVWKSEEDSKKCAGATYIVDDVTGKILNPPPVYNRSNTQSTPIPSSPSPSPTLPSTQPQKSSQPSFYSQQAQYYQEKANKEVKEANYYLERAKDALESSKRIASMYDYYMGQYDYYMRQQKYYMEMAESDQRWADRYSRMAQLED